MLKNQSNSFLVAQSWTILSCCFSQGWNVGLIQQNYLLIYKLTLSCYLQVKELYIYTFFRSNFGPYLKKLDCCIQFLNGIWKTGPIFKPKSTITVKCPDFAFCFWVPPVLVKWNKIKNLIFIHIRKYLFFFFFVGITIKWRSYIKICNWDNYNIMSGFFWQDFFDKVFWSGLTSNLEGGWGAKSMVYLKREQKKAQKRRFD